MSYQDEHQANSVIMSYIFFCIVCREHCLGETYYVTVLLLNVERVHWSRYLWPDQVTIDSLGAHPP